MHEVHTFVSVYRTSFQSEFVFSGGYSIIHKGYRGKHFLAGAFQQSTHMTKLSYARILGRIALTARASLPTLQVGGQFVGFIPKSVRISPFGWVPDIVTYTDATPRMTRAEVDAVRRAVTLIRNKDKLL